MVGLAGLQVAGGTAGAGEQFPSSAKQVILDSGTSALLVSKTDADSIHQARPKSSSVTGTWAGTLLTCTVGCPCWVSLLLAICAIR